MSKPSPVQEAYHSVVVYSGPLPDHVQKEIDEILDRKSVPRRPPPVRWERYESNSSGLSTTLGAGFLVALVFYIFKLAGVL